MPDPDPMSPPRRARPACAARPSDYGNTVPILHQIRHALDRLVATGEETRIDLSAIPFGPGDLDQLTAVLGSGEVRASVEALGATQVQETAIPGIWLVDYQSPSAQRMTLHIEVASVPQILRTPREDLEEAAAMLDARLQEHQETSHSPRSS